MSFRKFIRSLKLLTTPRDIAAKLAHEYPQHAHINSTARQLEAIVVDAISTTAKGNIVELLKVANIIVPIIAKEAIQQQIYLNIRNAIKNRFIDDSANPIIAKSYRILRFDQVKFRKIKREYNQKVFDANANKKSISLPRVVEIMDLVKNSNNIVDLAIGLQLACGARSSEILSFGEFTESKSDGYVIQNGILKQSTANPRERIIKPIIRYTRAEFFDMLTRMRALLHNSNGDMNHADIAKKYNDRINNKIKSLFNDPDITSHTLRKIYGNYSYDLFADKNHVSESSWLSDVLGHDPNSLSTSTSYSTVAVVDETIDRTDIPRNTKFRDGYTYERLKKTVEALNNNYKPINSRVLKSYGYGSAIVDKYMKSL